MEGERKATPENISFFSDSDAGEDHEDVAISLAPSNSTQAMKKKAKKRSSSRKSIDSSANRNSIDSSRVGLVNVKKAPSEPLFAEAQIPRTASQNSPSDPLLVDLRRPPALEDVVGKNDDHPQGPPLLEQIFTIVNRIEMKQEVFERQIINALRVGDHDIPRMRKPTNGFHGDQNQSQFRMPKATVLDELGDIPRMPKSTNGFHGDQNKSQFSKPTSTVLDEVAGNDAKRFNTERPIKSISDRGNHANRLKTERRAMMSSVGFGTLYVKISVQVVGESNWRCPTDLATSPVFASKIRSSKRLSKRYLDTTRPAKIRVQILSARGLRSSDAGGKSDPYCVCAVGTGDEIREHFHTNVVHDTLEPGWDSDHVFATFQAGDTIYFSVRDKDFHTNKEEQDEVLGAFSLGYDQFHPYGLYAPLRLCEASDEHLVLNAENDRTQSDDVVKLARLLPIPSQQVNQCGSPLQMCKPMLSTSSLTSIDAVLKASKDEWSINIASCTLIFLNVIFIGILIDYESVFFTCLDVLFVIMFSIELLLKFRLHTSNGTGFFLGPAARWNCFDLFIVLIDIAQLMLLASTSFTSNYVLAATFRMLRLARLLRLSKLFRMLYDLVFVEDLIAMIMGIAEGLPTLMWAIVLFLVVVYITALMFREFFGRRSYIMSCEECGDVDITDYFNSVPRAMLTVFRMFFGDFTTIQGVNIYEGVQIAYGTSAQIFVCLVFFVVFIALFNVITAIFVQRTVAAAEDLANIRMAERLNNTKLWGTNIELLIRKLYPAELSELSPEDSIFDLGVLELLTEEPVYHAEFSHFIKEPDVRRALDNLEISAADHEGLFEILDRNNTGSLTLLEFIDGLRRLRGNPRRSDVITIDLMVREIQTHTSQIMDQLSWLCENRDDGSYKAVHLGCDVRESPRFKKVAMGAFDSDLTATSSVTFYN